MSTFKEKMALVRFNPAAMQGVILDELERQLDNPDYDVPDASNPFVFLMEAGVLNGCMNLSEQESLLRRVYPSMALTQEELYLHMADVDYIDRFAAPASTVFELYLPFDVVLSRAVTIPDSDVRKLVIPRLSYFRIAETTFTMQYPIELRVMPHGGLQVVYDTDRPSPVQTLDSNMVDWDLLSIKGQRILKLNIPVKQFAVLSFFETISTAAGFDVNYDFADQFYYARVYLKNNTQDWVELHTTHTEQVYDPLKITAVLQVNNGQLNVTLPMVYFTQGLVDGQIRVDIYTTKGPIEMDLGSYARDQFEVKLIDTDDDPRYVSPMTTLPMLQALNTQLVSGGSAAVSFNRLRDQVIDNTLGSAQVPITNAQLTSELDRRGFTLVTNIDNITNRQFLAAKRLPKPRGGSDVTSAMGSTMGLLQFTLEDIKSSRHVKDNGQRMTLLPSMLFQMTQGKIGIVADSVIDQVLSMTPDGIARSVNDRRYLYTPFHYVLDTTRNAFDLRTYYLDNPVITGKTFVGDNDSTQLEVSIDSYAVTRVASGFEITLALKSGEGFKTLDDDQIAVQIGYQPQGEHSYASVNATFLRLDPQTKERVYRFRVETAYDLNERDGLYTTNFSMFDNAQRHFAIDLSAELDISIILVQEEPGSYRSTQLDTLLSTHLLGPYYTTITRERLSLTLGHALKGLWHRHRTLITEMSYQHYQDNVPYTYTETVYDRDPDTDIIILNSDDDGNVSPVILHDAGDPYLDNDGEPMYRHLKGDRILDGNNEPILISPRQLKREVNLFLVDGAYYFVTDDRARTYRDETPRQVIDWVHQDIEVLNRRLLEQSELYLYPTTTLGTTTARVKAGLETTVDVDQHFFVNYYMTNSAFGNVELRQALTVSTKQIVAELLGRQTVAVSDIIARLKANAGEDVISLEAGGLGGENDYSIITMTDDAVRLSLGKRLVTLSNQYLSVEDDIDVSFLRHNTPTYDN